MKKILINVMGLFGLLMILLQTYAVFSRTFLKVAAPWSDEVMKLLVIWIIFICSADAFSSDELIGLDILEDKIKNNTKFYKVIKIIQYLIGLIFGVFCTIWGYQIVQQQLGTSESTIVMSIPLAIINIGFLIGSIMIVVYAITKVIKEIKVKE